MYTSEPAVPPVDPSPAVATPDADASARRLAYVTVLVPTAGFGVAVWYSLRYGFAPADLVTLALMWVVTSLGIEGGFHRFFAHRSFSARPWLTTFFGLAGSMAAQGPVVFWVATHRQHHAFTDREGDPHSPRPIGDGRFARARGLWHGHIGWLFTIRRQGWSSYVPDLLRNRLIMKINQYYLVLVLLGLLVPAGLGWLIGDGADGAVRGLLWGGLARIFLLDQVTWGVNSIGHTVGSRRYETRDNSRNVAAMAPISAGGSWHNNHHAQPASAFNRHAFWQVDMIGAAIRLLEFLGLVADVRRPHRRGDTRRS